MHRDAHTEIGVTPVKAAPRIAVFFAAADRDPERFERPGALHFARMQLAIAIEELLASATNFALKPGDEVPRQVGPGLNSPYRRELTFDRSAE